ncbi:MAG: hypothetical protein HYR70_04220 [Chloroflexi bacterium]|nr:hypothetical protein [Chloroflexota bacterium]MBI3340762.1 hypothetical protein [Chloroflexota bacterium]
MEITFSRRTIILIILAVALLLAGAGGYYAWRSGLLNLWSGTAAVSAAPASDEPALTAIGAIYSPDVKAGRDAWESQVCANMTADGCQLFQKVYASAIWNAAQAGVIPANLSISFVGIAEETQDGQQVWKLSTSSTATPWIYALVAREKTTKKWMLVRLLFAQEEQALYGN